MRFAVARRVTALALLLVLASCSSQKKGGDAGAADSASADGGDAGEGGAGDTGSNTDSPDTGGSNSLTCASPSTAFQNNGGSCGTWRWAVKTGTDNDVTKVNMVPQETTIGALISLATETGGYCNRMPHELNTYILRDVNLMFEALEADSDYHIIASDPITSQTMVTEVPFPGCVGQNSCQSSMPFYCAISHARAAVDAKNPTQTYSSMGMGTIIGVGFFDTDELMNSPGPAGEAPNGVEIHPILAICFGTGCDPLSGY